MAPATNRKPNLKQACLIRLAVIAWLAVLLQIGLAVRTLTAAGQYPFVGIINTLSYFTILTILTILIVAIVSTAAALHSTTSNTPDTFLTRTSTLSAVAVYIYCLVRGAVTGLYPLIDPLEDSASLAQRPTPHPSDRDSPNP